LRLWPAVVLVALQWLAAFGAGMIAPGTPLQFFGMLGGPTIGLLLLLLWWLFFSRGGWRDRLIGLALVIATLVATYTLVHPTVPPALTVVGIPVFSLAIVAWLLLARSQQPRTRRLGAVAVTLVALLGWTLVRSNGVDGALNTDYAWRWSATTEERFLASEASGGIKGPAETILPIEDAAWPGFRGPHRDSRIEDLRIDTSWDSSPPQEIWRRPIGPGWSSFAVVGDRLYTQEQRGEEEVVACYDAAAGEPLWLHADSARFQEALAGPGPRATPTYHEGRIYALGATGILNCLDAATGEPRWSRRLTEDTGAKVPDWGFASSPLVVAGRVIVYAGGADGKGVAAYDAANGEPSWFAPAGAPSYSSPHRATIDGVEQVLMLTGGGATSLEPLTGRVLWDYAWPLDGAARVVQPHVDDEGRVLIGTGFGQGVRSIRVSRDGDLWTIVEGWTSRNLKPYYNDFVAHRGHLYGFDGSIFACIDAETGERKWKRGRYGNGQVLLLADQDLLLVLSESGELVLVGADPDDFREVARVPAVQGKTWNHPVLVGDRLYVRNGEEAVAFRLPVSGSGLAF